ncbi:MAG: apolipoprotein N-acyltransferase [Acidobacteria bacterium]|nr:apolipoprotein N-acyltransferase [Acidobacteriota bacterium]
MDSSAATRLRGSLHLRIAASIASGVALALAFPNASIAPLAFLALFPLIIAVLTARGGLEAFFLGHAAITVQWLINVPWVITVMSEQGGIPLPLGIGIYVLLAIILGIYGGLFTLTVWRLDPGRGWGRWIAIAVAWAVFEYARTILLSGFSWDLIAATIVDLPLVQLAPWTGPYLLGSMIVFPSVVAARMFMLDPRIASRIQPIAATAAYLIVWGLLGLIAQGREPASEGEALRVAVLQPNIALDVRWDPTKARDIYFLMQSMTLDAVQAGAEIIVWPESTVPYPFAITPPYRDWVEGVSRDNGVDVILGSIATADDGSDRVWNSAFLVHDGGIASKYDKIQLVPFGEYVPMQRALFFAEKLVRAVGNFQFGTSTEPLRGKLDYGLAICYEVVFPEIGRNQVRNGANILVTITNDSWFGETAAPAQHFQSARLRAIEADRWLIRAATTGISAAVTPRGRVVEEIRMNQSGMFITEVRPRTTLTPYVKWGDWFAIGGALLLIILTVTRRSQS